MMTRKRNEHLVAEVAAQDEDQTRHDEARPDVHNPLTDSATAAEITARAAELRDEAGPGHEHAAKNRGRAQELMGTAQAKADAIIREAETEARKLGDEADRSERTAHDLDEYAQRLDRAAAMAVKAEASEALVQALEDERDALARKQTEIGGRQAEEFARVRELEPQLAAALDVGVGGQVAAGRLFGAADGLQGRRTRQVADHLHPLAQGAAIFLGRQIVGEDGGIIERVGGAQAHRSAALRAQLAPVGARLDALGDGIMSPIWPQKLLTEARRVADMDRRRVTEALNFALPERPEAIAAKERDYEQLMDRMTSDRLATERAERARQPRQQIVHL